MAKVNVFSTCNVSVINMKEDSVMYVIIVLKMATRSPNLDGKKWHPLFSSKSVSKNTLKPKNQFQQANPTGAQNLTSWPLLRMIFRSSFVAITLCLF